MITENRKDSYHQLGFWLDLYWFTITAAYVFWRAVVFLRKIQ